MIQRKRESWPHRVDDFCEFCGADRKQNLEWSFTIRESAHNVRRYYQWQIRYHVPLNNEWASSIWLDIQTVTLEMLDKLHQEQERRNEWQTMKQCNEKLKQVRQYLRNRGMALPGRPGRSRLLPKE